MPPDVWAAFLFITRKLAAALDDSSASFAKL
jgi:hypothetical protein